MVSPALFELQSQSPNIFNFTLFSAEFVRIWICGSAPGCCSLTPTALGSSKIAGEGNRGPQVEQGEE